MAFSEPSTRKAFRSSFVQFPTIETDRLILGELFEADAEEYHRQLRSALDAPNRSPWASGFEADSVENARASLGFCQSAWKKKARLRFGLKLKDGSKEAGKLIGCCELFDFENQYKAEIGYWLGASYQGKGLMTEAVRAIVDHAFGTMGLGRIYAKTSTQNPASIAVLLKSGFIQEGIARKSDRRDGTWDDSALFAILAVYK